MKTTQVRLASYPVGEPKEDDFDYVEVDLPKLADGQVLLRTIYLSLDPYVRGRMSTAKSYADPMSLGDVIVGGTVCEVVASESETRSIGDLVLAYTGWQTCAVVDARETRLLNPSLAPVSTALGVLGMPGFTAYAGLKELGCPLPGETLVVAAAAGPVGSTVGQLAKMAGARTVGIAGGSAKCRVLRELGFDAAVDHRSPDFADELAAATPEGVDIYFENVGGAVSAAVARRLNPFARIPVCGLVSTYNEVTSPSGVDQLPGFMRRVLTLSLYVRGFIQDEFIEKHHGRFLEEMSAWVQGGEVQYLEDIVDGLAQAPEAFRGLLLGRNVGKLLVQVGEDPTRT